MKYIKLFEYYKSTDSICEKYKIYNYTINKDGSIDVNDKVDISSKRLSKLPLTFNKVYGNFDCANNQLTSLKGSPNYVDRVFFCYNNKLTSLEGGPKYVGNSYYCDSNKITSLKGSPDYIGEDFYFRFNKLTSLKYITSEINDRIVFIPNPLPKEIYDNKDYIKYIVKLQDEYQIWNYNDTLNLPRFELMMEEIKNK